jgi:alpha-L-fucosidase
MNQRTRREFLRSASAAAGAGLVLPAMAGVGRAAAAARPGAPESAPKSAGAAVPSYLKDYAAQYAKDPRAAAIQWFRDAKFGLFIHYGLYSLLGRHEWVQLRGPVPLAEYAKLADRFTCKEFDADFITDMALGAEMKYINLVTRHHDSFSLWDTKQSDFNSVKTAAKRDLVGELAEACSKKGLGFFCYYSHGRDWKHPHAPNPDKFGKTARPAYWQKEAAYKKGAEHDVQKYVDFMRAQITELLENYGPIAGIWLDGIGTSKMQKSVWHAQELYDYIHSKQPQVLVSYKQGFLGTEDFFAPERGKPAAGDANKAGKVADAPHKPLEICDTLQQKGWGLVKTETHKTPDQVMKMLAHAAHWKANLLLNTGPLGDGSIPQVDIKTLTEVGKRIRADGWPAAAKPAPAPKKPPRKPKGKGKKKTA